MGMGGIEIYYAQLMQYSLNQGYKIIWLSTNWHRSLSAFPAITNSTGVQLAEVRQTLFGPLFPRLSVSKEDDVVLLTNDPLRYVLSDTYRGRLRCRSFTHLLLLPHFAGAAYYPEQIFKPGVQRRYWHEQMMNLAVGLSKANCVRGFSKIHLQAYAEEYDLENLEFDDCTLPNMFLPPCPSEDAIVNRARTRSTKFEIITCSRFDMPHKGYIIGLIRAFNKINQKFPQTRLTIVGYGKGEDAIRAEISKLPNNVIGNIEMTGMLSTDDYIKRLNNAQLFVGLAGALLQAVQNAVPSICMRHYTYNCEGYGYYDNGCRSVSDEPGQNVVPLIEQAITMSQDEYVKLSYEGYRAYSESIDVNPEYVYRQLHVTKQPQINFSAAKARVLYAERVILSKACKRELFLSANSNTLR